MSEIKACPFCGGDCCEMQYPQVTSNYKTETKYSAGCPNCGVWTDYCDTEEQAITAWNRRADRWIPVSEGLPEYGDTVLVYIKHNYNDTDGWRAYRVYEYTDHWVGMGNLCEVIAWMQIREVAYENRD